MVKVHFIPKNNKQEYVMFLYDSLKFFNVNENTKLVVEDIIHGLNKTDILNKYQLKNNDFDNLSQILSFPEVGTISGESDDVLYKLVLNVTNKCNLNCKYCYANGGSYGSDEGMMDDVTAKKAIDTFLIKYKKIKFLQFFGGEPLINIPLIKNICEYFEYKFKSGEIKSMPEFGIISNGTICTDELIKLIKKYNISLTFSIDGPAVVHDSMRVYPNGNGTFDTIKENISKMKKSTLQPTSAEVTYNAYHIKNGFSVVDTIKYIKNNLAIQNIHIVPVSGNEQATYKLNSRKSFEDSVHEIFKEKIQNKKDYSYSFINRIIRSLELKKANKYLCEAGISSFSVSHKGDVYPCFMFTDIDDLKMGNVFDSGNLFLTKKFQEINIRLKQFSKFENPKCTACFNNKICSGCLGTNYFNNNSIETPTDKECDMQRKLTEQVLVELSELV